MEETLHSVGEMGLGVNNDDGRVFWPGGGGGVTGQGGAGCWSAQFGSEEVERYVVCVKEGRVAAVEGWYDMRPRGHDARGRKVVATARNCAPFYSRFLPEYIRLPVVDGWVVFPTNGVGTVVEAEEAWHRRLGSVDGTDERVSEGQPQVVGGECAGQGGAGAQDSELLRAGGHAVGATLGSFAASRCHSTLCCRQELRPVVATRAGRAMPQQGGGAVGG